MRRQTKSQAIRDLAVERFEQWDRPKAQPALNTHDLKQVITRLVPVVREVMGDCDTCGNDVWGRDGNLHQVTLSLVRFVTPSQISGKNLQ